MFSNSKIKNIKFHISQSFDTLPLQKETTAADIHSSITNTTEEVMNNRYHSSEDSGGGNNHNLNCKSIFMSNNNYQQPFDHVNTKHLLRN